MSASHQWVSSSSVTAVTPGAAGYATVYSGELASAPFVASINYAANDIVNNTVFTNVNPASSPDYKIYSFATSHYVVDIIGYYDNPHATALDCTITTVVDSTPANAFKAVSGTSCPAGYAQVSLDCDTGSYTNVVAGQRFSTRQCFYANSAASASSSTVSVNCCRVPGR